MDKTYKCTAPVRWRKYDIYNDNIYAVITGHGNTKLALQQAWECVETGEIEWRDVPMEGD